MLLSEETAFRIEVDLGEAVEVGRTPYGGRRVVEILAGRVSGARLAGIVVSGGADWQILREDGVTDIQARYVIKTDHGAHVLVRSEACATGRRECLTGSPPGKRSTTRFTIFARSCGSRRRRPSCNG